MVKIKSGFTKIKNLFLWIKVKPKRIIITVVLVVIIGLLISKLFPKKAVVSYQTAIAETGSLIVSITASGQVSSSNNTSVSTQASGVVKTVYVENGQMVNTGDKIAELDLDLEGKLRSTQSWASYQGAQNNLENAKISMFTLQSSMLTQWKSYKDLAESGTYQNGDGTPRNDNRTLPQFMSVQDDWLTTEAKYKNQQNVVNQAQTSLNAAWLSYQQSSPIIYAPITGTVTGLSLQQGIVLVAQSGSSGNATSQKIASIKTNAAAQISVSLTEIDVTKIKVGQKATLKLDALADKTYTGKVISIDTIGAISSGVTNYPAIIGLDSEVPEILPNMSVTATIITNIVNDVILIPSQAVQTTNGTSIVKVMKNGKVSEVNVAVGETNNTQTSITSGISEGDDVVTGTVNSGNAKTQSTTSIFGSMGGGNRGGAIRGTTNIPGH